jgi:hypothetical protein
LFAIHVLSCRVQVRNTMMAKKGQPNRVEEAFSLLSGKGGVNMLGIAI